MDEAFNDYLNSYITGSGIIVKAERHLLSTPGAKRIRPGLVFACGRLFGVSKKELLDSAVGVELMHTGSLLHDDIIDKADTRRGRPSVNARYGNSMAILAGDRLLSRSALAFTRTKNSVEATKQAALTFVEITGAMGMEEELKPANATPAKVLKLADGKTGALMGLCGYLVGLAADDMTAAERLGAAGRLLGRAFQLRDDIEDIEEDIANEVPTLPQLVSKEEVETVIVDTLRQVVEQLKPYSDRPGYTELVESIYRLTRTSMPSL